jgi:hypothetical protein
MIADVKEYLEYETYLEDYLEKAKGIAWDSCHKIYVLMDDKQMEVMKEYEYDPLIPSSETSPEEMFNTIVDWFSLSCSLKFIQAVTTEPVDGECFHDIVGQFDYPEDEEDE